MTSSVQHPVGSQVAAADLPKRAQVPEADVQNPVSNPVRRLFTAEYRARVVAEYEVAPHGKKAGVLRLERLYQAQVREWRAERDVRLAGLVPKRSPHRPSQKLSGSETDGLRGRMGGYSGIGTGAGGPVTHVEMPARR